MKYTDGLLPCIPVCVHSLKEQERGRKSDETEWYSAITWSSDWVEMTPMRREGLQKGAVVFTFLGL
jgi:hypothetical protein